METLFGKSQIQQLLEMPYTTNSHTLSKSVIAAYYNLLEYESEVTDNHIIVYRRGKVKVLFFPLEFNEEILNPIRIGEKDIIYCKEKTNITKNKVKEVVYDLEKIFTNPNKQVRRGITLTNRKEIVLRDCTSSEIVDLYQEWTEHKMNDPKVFRIAFTPKRYLRSFELKEKGFNVIYFGYFINGELYGALSYEVQGDTAFELAFISRFWRKDLKLVNDLNECILTNSFYELFKKGVKKINVGPTAGIKGLKIFKSKLPSEEVIIYTN